MKLAGIIPPVVTPFLPTSRSTCRGCGAHRPHARRRASTASSSSAPPASSTPSTRPRSRQVVAAAVEHVPRAVAGVRRHRGRDHPRGRPPHEDGREGRGRRRVRHHPVLHQADAGGAARPLPPRRREHDAAGRAVQQPGHLRRRQHRAGHRRPARRGAEHRRHQGLVRRPAEHHRDSSQHAARTRSRVLNGRDTLILAALHVRGAGGDPRVVQHRPGAVRRHLRVVREGRRGGGPARSRTGCTRCGWR